MKVKLASCVNALGQQMELRGIYCQTGKVPRIQGLEELSASKEPGNSGAVASNSIGVSSKCGARAIKGVFVASVHSIVPSSFRGPVSLDRKAFEDIAEASRSVEPRSTR